MIFSSVYVSGDNRKEAEELVDVKEKFLDWLGYEPSEKGSLIRGSWWQRTKSIMKKTVSNPDVQERAQAVEDALFGGVSIIIDEKASRMINETIDTLGKVKVKSALIDCGMFLFIQTKDEDDNPNIYAKRLTFEDRRTIDDNPELLKDPHNILENLGNMKRIRRERIEAIRRQAKGLVDSDDQGQLIGPSL
jgi:hypothetical protein